MVTEGTEACWACGNDVEGLEGCIWCLPEDAEFAPAA